MLAGLVGTALLFDFLNGLHDSANSIATVVATRVLRPFTAVLWAAFFNFIAFTVFGLHVTATMGNGVIHAGIVDPVVIFAALSGAIVWNLLTWRLGIPSSSSHALASGLVGAGFAKGGFAAVLWGRLGGTGSAIVLAAAPRCDNCVPLALECFGKSLKPIDFWLCCGSDPLTEVMQVAVPEHHLKAERQVMGFSRTIDVLLQDVHDLCLRHAERGRRLHAECRCGQQGNPAPSDETCARVQHVDV